VNKSKERVKKVHLREDRVKSRLMKMISSSMQPLKKKMMKNKMMSRRRRRIRTCGLI
jgi:hypothetical protein